MNSGVLEVLKLLKSTELEHANAIEAIRDVLRVYGVPSDVGVIVCMLAAQEVAEESRCPCTAFTALATVASLNLETPPLDIPVNPNAN
jgi:hypothetical protein